MLNFNAGPAALPPEVLQQAAQAVIDYDNTGLSILEIPHRGKHVDAIIKESETLVKELCGLNDDYEVLWMHGGGRLQFCMLPMNFLGENETAGYIDSGSWAHEAMEYAKYYGNVEVLASSRESNYNHLPALPTVIPNNLTYLHITTNNTIFGTQCRELPISPVPLIADMSSDIFSKKTDYSRCALFYAVAQKNLGAAGVTLVVVRKDLLGKIKRTLPPMLDYKAHAAQHSVLNTPPVFALYICLLTLRRIKAKGIDTIEKENNTKAQLLYNEVSRNSLFHTSVKYEDRSLMNVCFTTKNKEDEATFTAYCEERNIVNIGGHRTTGGFRISLYNAISISAVETLVSVMQQFEKEHK